MGRLIVIGSGIKSIAHLTEESLVLLRNCEKLLFLVNDKIMSNFLMKEHKNAESLDEIYFNYTNRQDSYKNLTDKIVSDYCLYSSVCVVLYGHPTFFADFALNAVIKIRQQGGTAYVLPAISSLDCLFADLLINPGQGGLCVYDATELLIYKKNIDVNSNLVLYQVSSLGMNDMNISKYLDVLKKYLMAYYPPEHELAVYTASQIPGKIFSNEVKKLKDLAMENISHISTIFIPPLKRGELNSDILELFNYII
ncbi:SAM-dependent methyltransferase [Legionella sp. 227]|uniref:SAM-dependent methyltransferase n=1 Tax=Legionella sp. 227 TaxID=3367288 RepID=UPI00370DB93D